MFAVQHPSVTGCTVLVDASALLPGWQSGSLRLGQLRAETQVWISVRLRELMIFHGAFGLLHRLREVAATLLRGLQPAPSLLVRLRAWPRVPPEALCPALTPDRVGSGRDRTALRAGLTRRQLRPSARLRLAPRPTLPASP